MNKLRQSFRLFFYSGILFLAVTATTPAADRWNGGKYMDSLRATGADKLHAIGITGYGVSAAVLDTPYDIYHERLRGHVLESASAGFSLENGADMFRYSASMTKTLTDPISGGTVYWNTGPDAVAMPGLTAASRAEYDQVTDFSDRFSGISHGTHVSGTIAAMAPDAKLVLTHAISWKEADPNRRNSESADQANITSIALNYLAGIADTYNIVAVNNSWGAGNFGTPDNDEFGDELQNAINALNHNGVAVVFATGNEAVNAKDTPSNFQGVIPVGAVTPDGLLATFSNHEPDDKILLAPGVTINSSVPYNKYSVANGTSMASPHVTGAITLLASGARNAGSDEIYAALWHSADVTTFDAATPLPPSEINRRGTTADLLRTLQELSVHQGVDFSFIADLADPDAERTLEEWRQLDRLRQTIGYYVRKMESEYEEKYNREPTRQEKIEMLVSVFANGEANNAAHPYMGRLGAIELRTIQVDKAYRWLTDYRMNLRGAETADYNAAAPAMLSAFGGELGAELSRETAEIFQRLDAQTTEVLARAGRQMSPQWTASAVEYAQLGVAGLHRSLGRKGEISRLAKTILPSAFDECEPCEPESFSASVGAGIWVEGFGSFGDRSGSIKRAGYDGHFAGTSLGFDVTRGAFTFGAFGSWADFRAKGSDGRSDGDWYNAGLYGRFDRERYFVEASASYNHGRFDTSRYVEIPGARFTTTQANVFIDMPGDTRTARAKNRVNGLAVRLAGGYDFEPGCDFVIGPRVEGSLNRSHVSGYRENGAGALALDVNGYSQTYAEAGAGFAASKTFRRSNGSSLVAWGKVTGLYGMGFGGDLRGQYVNNGSAFRFSPKRHSGLWLVPEAALTWNVNERVSVTAAYAGRFGKKYSENSGSLNFGLSF